MQANLVNKNTNEVKNVKVGFSWTEFFFGFWPAVFRGDWKWLLIMLLVDVGLGVFTWGGGSLLFNFIFAFFYNKFYVKDLIEKGFEPSDEGDYHTLVAQGYIQPNMRFGTAYNNSQNTANVTTDASLEELDKLKKLLDDGTITQEEFDAKKKQLLGL
ncbi:SHOCT domain-containing protein [Companilactobacillus jidongensis]|uniref:SHOCT domain-containing protein n=1 Tax=Companilactobacillus jidongensis TaxID=2486006 RepID=UPI000F7A0F47